MGDEAEKNDQASGFTEYLNKILDNTLDQNTFFTLENQTIVALDILPKINFDTYLPENIIGASGTSRNDSTVYAVLNKCRTVSGRRLLIKWLQNPLMSKDKIDRRLDIVKHFVDNTELRTACYDEYLRKSCDLMRLSFKIRKEKCNLNELVNIYKACKSIERLCPNYKQILKISSIEAPQAVHDLINWIQTCCNNLAGFNEVIDRSVDIDNTDESGDLMVKPNSNEEIAKISLEINDLCRRAKKVLYNVADDVGLEPDKTIKLEVDGTKGFDLKVTKLHEQSIRGNSNYEQSSIVKKDGYRFTSRELTRLSNKYINAKEEYNLLAKNVILDIIKEACMFDGEVQEFAMAVSMLDVFVALAVAAIQNDYNRPIIYDIGTGRLSFESLRHPCVENQPDVENYVPNHLTMSKHCKKFYIITGPNMGGKSTFIKSVAVAIIMGQIGSLVPAYDPRLTIVDGVYTRIGAGDRQSEGISTFMEEMLDMSTILKSATENSLVIIDELGRGTSTFDGFGLAWSISKHLATEIKCFTLFATHFHELTEMEEDTPLVGNLHVKALCQNNELVMLYNISTGVCDESYGINVARYTKFPVHVYQAAKEKHKQFEEVPGFKNKFEVKKFIIDVTNSVLGSDDENIYAKYCIRGRFSHER